MYIYVPTIFVKRAFAILLIFVFLFNVIGYYGIYVVMITQAHTALNQKIDNNDYTTDQTFTVKIPLALPYPVQQNNFERVQGEFEYQGEYYKLVKQKYENDTVFVVCLKNNDHKKAVKVFKDLVKLSTDQSPASNKQQAKSIASMIKDFNPVTVEIDLFARQCIELCSTFGYRPSPVLIQEGPEFSPPPETRC